MAVWANVYRDFSASTSVHGSEVERYGSSPREDLSVRVAMYQQRALLVKIVPRLHPSLHVVSELGAPIAGREAAVVGFLRERPTIG